MYELFPGLGERAGICRTVVGRPQTWCNRARPDVESPLLRFDRSRLDCAGRGRSFYRPRQYGARGSSSSSSRTPSAPPERPLALLLLKGRSRRGPARRIGLVGSRARTSARGHRAIPDVARKRSSTGSCTAASTAFSASARPTSGVRVVTCLRRVHVLSAFIRVLAGSSPLYPLGPRAGGLIASPSLRPAAVPLNRVVTRPPLRRHPADVRVAVVCDLMVEVFGAPATSSGAAATQRGDRFILGSVASCHSTSLCPSRCSPRSAPPHAHPFGRIVRPADNCDACG